ncbi:MAG: hypothetical protein ACYSVY_00060 [Planctomycetota bacterium]|jgi:hypothetical protein
MKILAYTGQRWRVSTLRMLRATGADFDLLTCPPLSDREFPYRTLPDYDVLYLRLHGLPGQSSLYGSSWRRRWGSNALSVSRFVQSGVAFDRPIRVFFEGCYAAQMRLPALFLEAGAREVVASPTETYNNTIRVGPAGRIGLAVVRAWLRGEDAESVLYETLLRVNDDQRPMVYQVFRESDAAIA